MTGTVGLIGTGAVGGTIARLAVRAGLDVLLSNSRGPDSLGSLVDELGPHAGAGTVSEIARDADLVIAAIPLSAYRQLPAGELAGKIVVDATNYYPQRDGRIAVLDDQQSTASELVQGHLSSAKVVKAFNSITFASLGNGARPSGAPDRSALPIAGNHAAAVAEVSALLDVLGYDAVDIGQLGSSWRSEPGTPVYCDPYMPAWPTEKLPFDQLLSWLLAAPVIPVSQQKVAELIARATRGPAGGYFPETA